MLKLHQLLKGESVKKLGYIASGQKDRATLPKACEKNPSFCGKGRLKTAQQGHQDELRFWLKFYLI